MNKSTSAYLNFVRFSAASIVFLSHASFRLASDGLFWQIGALSQEAVTVFFVLSGFVISYTAEKREKSAKTYVINRSARIYSVAVPALMLTFLADAVGSLIRPELYSASAGYSADDRVWQMLNGLLFTSQLWSSHIRIGTNFPYWSISYEVWYYVAFGFIAFAPRRWALAAAAAALVAAGPKISVLFPIWLLGFAGYRLCARRPLGRWSGRSIWIGSMGLLVTCKWLTREHGKLWAEFSVTPQRFADYGYYYAIGALFMANLIGFRSMDVDLDRVPQWLPRSARWLGERTFSLYLFHMPLLFLIAAAVPWHPASLQTRLLVFLGTPTLCFALAEATELRKREWRRTVIKIWERASRFRSGLRHGTDPDPPQPR